MTLLWAFDLAAVARRCLYLDLLHETQSVWDVQRIIEAFCATSKARAWRAIPH